MKHFIYLWLVYLGIGQSMAQTPSGTVAKNILPSFSPQSPNVAALGRYGEYPVSTYTGVPSITIPIYDIKAGSIEVPIRLNYHAAGIKVSDVTSWVGLGWSLSAGGSVSRSVVGLPDDQFGNYMDNPIPSDLTYRTASELTCEPRRFVVQKILDGRQDSGADIFQYNFP